MQATPLFEERVLFSPNIPKAVNELLQAAVAASHADKPRAEQLFKQAQAADPSCLQTYFALYKFYFYQGRLQEAEREALAALEQAAALGEFPNDYQRLANEAAQWDMYASETHLFYLYSLKALSFIKLRSGQEEQSREILSKIRILDPEDRCGASVIMTLAAALDEENA